jgi:toxin ParE1/3/4
MKLSWSERALQQLEHQIFHIAQDRPYAAQRMYERIQECARDLSMHPMLGHVGRRSGTRELPIAGTPYTLVYRVTGAKIQIAAVWHAKQSRRRQ